MGYRCLFLDNESYSAGDVNKAFSRLTTQGVSLFNDTGNALMDLNTAMSNIITSGVELFNNDACKVTLTNGIYKISQGTAFMADGASITFDSDGHVLNVETGNIKYVYLKSNQTLNKVDIVVSDTAGGSDTVPLATIGANGAVTDTRIFATTKVAPCTANVSVKKNITINFYTGSEQTQYVEIGYSGFSKLLYSGWVFDANIFKQYIDLSDGEYKRISFDKVATGNGYKGGYVKKSGSGLIFKNYKSGSTYYDWNETIEFEVM